MPVLSLYICVLDGLTGIDPRGHPSVIPSIRIRDLSSKRKLSAVNSLKDSYVGITLRCLLVGFA